MVFMGPDGKKAPSHLLCQVTMQQYAVTTRQSNFQYGALHTHAPVRIGEQSMLWKCAYARNRQGERCGFRMKMKRCQVNPACILTIEEPACLFPIMIFNGEEGFSFARYFQKFTFSCALCPARSPTQTCPLC